MTETLGKFGALPECTGDHCITCSDEGVPMRVERVDAAMGLATCVDEKGEQADVMTALVAGIEEGDMLLVHAGTALARLRQDENRS
jgi:hydrogenase maturation factor